MYLFKSIKFLIAKLIRINAAGPLNEVFQHFLEIKTKSERSVIIPLMVQDFLARIIIQIGK
jgi:hypothetical protein